MGLFRRRKPAPAAAGVDAGAGLSRADREEQAWREGVEQHGWLVFDIPSNEPRGHCDGAPGFQFTVGLTQRDLPEMIVYGLSRTPDGDLERSGRSAGRRGELQ